MKQNFDIRTHKKNLRQKYLDIRADVKPDLKLNMDKAILENVRSLEQYQQCKTVLCFVSTKIEVDTHKLIDLAIADGKTVAVPYCVDGTRKMLFYCINSLEQLTKRTFGVLEPNASECEELKDFSDSICILPGLAFDMDGYRLGYGGGYYDRFLSRVYTGTTVGICYSNCVRVSLVRGRFDIPCKILVTDRDVTYTTV